jgi:IclR family mhp operon transcriptional activator
MATQLRTLDRGLSVLGHLNRVRAASAQDIATAVSLPLPTVYRIIETLSHAGYVERANLAENAYQLAMGVRRLSGGMTCESVFIAVATPVLFARRQQLKLPSAVSTYAHGFIAVRESTDRFTPNSIGTCGVRMQIPMLSTPLGWAYLAFCNDEQRREILAQLRKSQAPEDRVARDSLHVSRMIRSVRRDGYCASASDDTHYKHRSSIALPVLCRGMVLGCISTVWPSTLLSREAAIARCLPVLRETKAEIEHNLEAAGVDW